MSIRSSRQAWLLCLFLSSGIMSFAMVPTWIFTGTTYFGAETYECWATPNNCSVSAVAETPKGGTCVTAQSDWWAEVETYTISGQLYDSDYVLCAPN